MSRCKCEQSTHYRATSEETGGNYLYIRCSECGGKVGIAHDKEELVELLTDPAKADERVTLAFDPHDSPWLHAGDAQ